MGSQGKQAPRRPATVFAHLRKKQARTTIAAHVAHGSQAPKAKGKTKKHP